MLIVYAVSVSYNLPSSCHCFITMSILATLTSVDHGYLPFLGVEYLITVYEVPSYQ